MSVTLPADKEITMVCLALLGNVTAVASETLKKTSSRELGRCNPDGVSDNEKENKVGPEVTCNKRHLTSVSDGKLEAGGRVIDRQDHGSGGQ